jgi:enoyl-CoA hydratase
MASGVNITDDGHLRIIEIDRPKTKNAIDRATGKAIREAWQEFDADDRLHVGILTATGDVFSSAADYNDIEGLEDDFYKTDWGFMGFTRLSISKPTIAAVSGICVAVELALWCDLRVADESARFGFTARRFGRPMLDGGTQRLPRLIGMGRALEMIMTGRLVDAKEAKEIGLVNDVVPKGQALAKAIELGRRIADFPQYGLKLDRQAVYAGWGTTLEEGLRIEKQIVGPALRQQEATSGVVNFKSEKGSSRLK